MNEYSNAFRSLSLTGRLCYLFMCIEQYLVTCYADEPTLALLLEAQSVLSKHSIDFPDLEPVKCLTVDRKNGWGDLIDSRYLSKIISP